MSDPVVIYDQFGVPLDYTVAAQIQGDKADGATDGGNAVKIGGLYQSTLDTYTNGLRVPAHFGTRGALHVQVMAADGTSGTQVGTSADGASASTNRLSVRAQMEIFNGTTVDRLVKPHSNHRLLTSAASTNATNFKNAAGNLHRIVGFNTNAAARYLKIHNKATAPTVGSDTPVMTFYLQPQLPFMFEWQFGGYYFDTGIGYALTTAAADADTGALSSGDVVCMNITYS